MPVVAAAAGVDVILVALVGAILAVALAMLFRPLLVGALASLPVVGGFVASRVDSLLVVTADLAAAPAAAAMGPLADLARRVHAVLDTLARYNAGTFDNVFNTLWRLVAIRLPKLERDLVQHTDQVGAAAIAYAQQVAAAAIAHADQVGRLAIAHADEVGAQDVAYTQQAVLTAEVTALHDVELAIAHADQVGQLAITHADQVGAAVEAQADLADRTLLDYVSTLVRDVDLEVERLTAWTDQAVRGAERTAVDHADRVGAATAAAAAAATAAVASRVGDIEKSPCQRFCGPLGDLGGLLQGLEDAGMVAILLGLAAEVVRDPKAVRDEVSMLLGGPARAALDELRASAGIGR